MRALVWSCFQPHGAIQTSFEIFSRSPTHRQRQKHFDNLVFCWNILVKKHQSSCNYILFFATKGLTVRQPHQSLYPSTGLLCWYGTVQHAKQYTELAGKTSSFDGMMMTPPIKMTEVECIHKMTSQIIITSFTSAITTLIKGVKRFTEQSTQVFQRSNVSSRTEAFLHIVLFLV